MNVVDSSGWLEYMSGGTNADFFAPAIRETDQLLVPVICLYEVFKRVAVQQGEQNALQAVGLLYRGSIVPITDELALQAAQLSILSHLPMADSLILAVAQLHEATVWTQDEHLRDLPGVKYIAKSNR
jgi:predicted nucleic acid-binding protein